MYIMLIVLIVLAMVVGLLWFVAKSGGDDANNDY